MSIRIRSIIAIGMAGLFAAGCTNLFRRSEPAAPEPLPAAPTSAVTESSLPPPAATPDQPAGTDMAAVEPGAATLDAPAAAASGVALTRTDVLGSWNLAAAGDSCQLTMVLTTWTGGYRASTRGCTNTMLQGISAWNLEGNQVQLMNDSGATVARLYPSSRTQFNGTSEGGGPVSVSR